MCCGEMGQLGVMGRGELSRMRMLKRGVEEGGLRRECGLSARWGFGWKGRARVWSEDWD